VGAEGIEPPTFAV